MGGVGGVHTREVLYTREVLFRGDAGGNLYNNCRVLMVINNCFRYYILYCLTTIDCIICYCLFVLTYVR